MHIPPFQNSLPGTAMASTCLVPHCRDTGSWADSLQEVGAPVLEWGSLSCPISFPLVTRIPAPQSLFLGFAMKRVVKATGIMMHVHLYVSLCLGGAEHMKQALVPCCWGSGSGAKGR